MAAVERVFIYPPEHESPFTAPPMVCVHCGKRPQNHHPLYCNPVEARAIMVGLSLVGLLGAVCAVAPWFLG